MSCSKEDFTRTINEHDDSLPKGMSDCWNYGMTWGCDIDCPVLRRDECDLQDAENKQLYKEMKEDRDYEAEE